MVMGGFWVEKSRRPGCIIVLRSIEYILGEGRDPHDYTRSQIQLQIEFLDGLDGHATEYISAVIL